MINFVTGPDEYAVAVNNNCYTNYTAKCALEYAAAAAQRMEVGQPARWQSLTARLALRPAEPARWREVAAGLYIPFNEELGIHEQDDTFLERTAFDRRLAAPDDLPAGRKWPWYRLMQSQAMKQADVVLLMFKRNDDFPPEVKRANFDFYEPKTTHESSLSPCIYSIMAAELGRRDAAFEYYLRSARLDLDDVNGNAHQGQHTASIAGSCLCVINGFGGLRVRRGTLTFSPCLPEGWRRLAFRVRFRGRTLHLEIEPAHMRIRLSGADLEIAVNGAPVALRAGEIRTLTLPPA